VLAVDKKILRRSSADLWRALGAWNAAVQQQAQMHASVIV
jgi:hypothetical protein